MLQFKTILFFVTNNGCRNYIWIFKPDHAYSCFILLTWTAGDIKYWKTTKVLYFPCLLKLKIHRWKRMYLDCGNGKTVIYYTEMPLLQQWRKSGNFRQSSNSKIVGKLDWKWKNVYMRKNHKLAVKKNKVQWKQSYSNSLV